MTAAVADFTGWATRHNVQCTDGRTILEGAFQGDDGAIVPLVWQHGHGDVENVLGYAKLSVQPEGVKCEAFFNETAKGLHAKGMVKHGDVRFLSIFANSLKETIKDKTRNLRDVLHGRIKEVSLVIAGANSGATIDHGEDLTAFTFTAVGFAHSDDGSEYIDEAIIHTGLEINVISDDTAGDDTTTLEDTEGGELSHEAAAEVLDTLNEEQKTAVYYLLSQALTVGSEVQHSDEDGEVVSDAESEGDDEGGDEEAAPEEEATSESSESDTDTEGGDEEAAPEEGASSEDTATEAGEDVQHSDNTNQEDTSMNTFDQFRNGGGTAVHEQVRLSHSDVATIVENAKKQGSLKEAVENYLEHTGITVGGELKHGIENIDYLFPDSKTLENSPAFISRRMEWVDKVLSSVRKSPFSRIKTITADITPDEARARGYIKGNMKNEEYFALAKRETTPQTIYKKQKLDRDDVIDIVDLDVVAWLKAEMKVMLDEELAGAILIGDGRSAGSDDKIKEINIRPIASDAELYVTTVNVNLLDGSSSIEELVDAAINNRQYYKGTGQPTFYTTEAIIAKFLTVKDNFGRRIYSNLAEVASVLRCSDVVAVEVMERVPDLVGIMVNLADYTLGADRGGQATMFDDFDIDYNKLRYLIETRCSGALTTPKSALVFRSHVSTDVELAQPTAPTFESNVVTVPTVSNVTYKNFDTNATLTTGAPVTLTTGQSLHVIAVAAAGKYFPNNVQDEWTFEYQA